MIHCGVTHSGFVAVAGDTADIADGQSISSVRGSVAVTRTGEQCTFTREVAQASRAA